MARREMARKGGEVSNVIVVGDQHARFSDLNALIAKKRPDIILSVGDFGYWPVYRPTKIDDGLYKNKNYIDLIKPGGTKIYFAPGNHEHWDMLNGLEASRGYEEPIEVARNIYYCPRGSSLLLGDGRNVLFMGGADSIDKRYRTIKLDWFPQEIITQNDLDKIQWDVKYDIVVSHTCPDECVPVMLPYNQAKNGDPSSAALSLVYQRVRPKLWYFGHWHNYKTGLLGDGRLKWTALSHPPKTGWWCYLDN